MIDSIKKMIPSKKTQFTHLNHTAQKKYEIDSAESTNHDFRGFEYIDSIKTGVKSSENTTDT